MLRVLFLLPVITCAAVSGWFNVLFSLTLSEGLERWVWVAFGLGCASYSALGLDIARQNFKRGAPLKGIAALVFLAAAMAWDARCAYGYSNIEQTRASRHVEDEERKRAQAKANADNARRALEPYINALDPVEADAAVDTIERRTNDARCRIRQLSKEDRELCDQLSQGRIAAARAHAKVRFTKALEDADATLNATKAPPAREALAELIGPEWAKALPAIILQLGTLLGVFAASIPKSPRKPAPVPANAPNLPRGGQTAARPMVATPRASPPPTALANGSDAVVSIVAQLIAEPGARPPGVGIDTEGWLAGPQRRLATLLRMPVSKFNRELKAAVQSGALEMTTRGGVTRLRVPIVRHH